MIDGQNETEYQTQRVIHEKETLVSHEFLDKLYEHYCVEVVQKIACFVFHEMIVLHVVRTIIDLACGDDLSAALDFLRDSCGIECECVEGNSATTKIGASVVAFCVPLPDTQAVLLHAMWQQEKQWRTSPPDTFPFNEQEIDHLRLVVRNHLDAYGLCLLTEQEALSLLLPPGPYATYLGPVVVRWNNTSCRTTCPFCSEDFKPTWGMWAFLYDLGGFPICFDCWRKGPDIAPSADAKTIPALPGHSHEFESNDTEASIGSCATCGAHWTLQDGWWRQNGNGIWCREVAIEQ